MTSDLVMEIKDGIKLSGSHVMLNRKHSSIALSQLWYEDETGIIRSKLNGYVIDLTGLTATFHYINVLTSSIT